MKVCHITSAHSTNDIRIFYKQCRSLANANYETYLLSRSNEYFTDDKVKIVQIDKSKNRLERMLTSNHILLKEALKIDADVYQAHDPELLPLLNKLQKKGKKVVFDFHEDFSEQLKKKTYLLKPLRAPISLAYSFYERSTVKKMNGIITATPFLKDKFLKYNKNTVNINNYPLLNEFKKAPVDVRDKLNKIIYVGGLSSSRGIFTMIELAKKRPEYDFFFCGKFHNKDEEIKIKKIATKNCIFTGQLSREEVVNHIYSSKIGLVLLNPLERFKVSLPIKLFEYMAAGLPVLASNFKLWEEIVTDNHCGFNENPQDIEILIDKIDTLITDEELNRQMGYEGRNKVFNNYNWKNEENDLLEFYTKMGES